MAQTKVRPRPPPSAQSESANFRPFYVKRADFSPPPPATKKDKGPVAIFVVLQCYITTHIVEFPYYNCRFINYNCWNCTTILVSLQQETNELYSIFCKKTTIYVTYTTIFVLNNYSPKKGQLLQTASRQYLSSTGWLKAGYGLGMKMMRMGHIQGRRGGYRDIFQGKSRIQSLKITKM